MKKLFFLLIILFPFFSNSVYSQEKQCTLKIEFIGKKYNNLNLLFAGYNSEEHVYGTSTDKSNWLFTYSDDIYERHSFVFLYMPRGADESDTAVDIIFEIPEMEITDFSSKLDKSFEKNSSIVCKYDSTKVYPNRHEPDEKYTADFFTVIDNKDTELALSAILSGYAYKSSDKDWDLVPKYPDSHYLMARFADHLYYYAKESDKEKHISIYNLFSEKNKKSFWGIKAKEYIEKNTGNPPNQ